MLGRVCLLWLNQKVRRLTQHHFFMMNSQLLQLGERLAIYVYTTLAIAYAPSVPRCPHPNRPHRLELVVWLVPSLIGGSVAVSLVGVLLGQDNGKTINVANSFGIPFEEDERDPKTWFLDHNYIEGMWEMFKKVNGG